MRWQDLDLEAGLWTLPREATKAGRLHEVPLSPLALKVLEVAKRTSKEYVFSTNGKTPISGFSRGKAKADQTVAIQRLKAEGKGKPTKKQITTSTSRTGWRRARSGSTRSARLCATCASRSRCRARWSSASRQHDGEA